eukprot:scaffold1808_cov360-Prasinococcus_capsulatus_cf.AAC.22
MGGAARATGRRVSDAAVVAGREERSHLEGANQHDKLRETPVMLQSAHLAPDSAQGRGQYERVQRNCGPCHQHRLGVILRTRAVLQVPWRQGIHQRI